MARRSSGRRGDAREGRGARGGRRRDPAARPPHALGGRAGRALRRAPARAPRARPGRGHAVRGVLSRRYAGLEGGRPLVVAPPGARRARGRGHGAVLRRRPPRRRPSLPPRAPPGQAAAPPRARPSSPRSRAAAARGRGVRDPRGPRVVAPGHPQGARPRDPLVPHRPLGASIRGPTGRACGKGASDCGGEEMAEGAKEKIGEVVGAAKAKVSGGGPPVATDVEGRVQIVRDALQAFGNGEHDEFVGQLHEDVEWDSPTGGNFPGGGEADGHDGLKQKFLGDIGRTYSSFGFRPSTYLETDDQDTVVVIGQFVAEGVKGETVDVAGVQIWDFESGKAVRIQTITDSAAFPAVITEADEEEEQEEQEKQEKEQAESSSDESSDSGDESGSEGDDDESRDDDEGESRDDDESH